MSSAATDWSNSPLSRVTSLIKDGSHGSHIDFDGGIPLLSAKDVLDGKLLIPGDCRRISPSDYASIHKNYEISPGDILLTIVGTIGRSCLISGNKSRFSVQRSVAILRPDGICAEYLHQVIRSYQFQQQLKDFVNASAQGGVYLSSLAKCDVSYPVDIAEQEKIAEILSTLDRAIEQTEALIAKQQRIKTGLMQDLLTFGLDEQGNIRSEATHAFKDSPLGRIPVEWDVVKLGEVSEISSGVTLGKIHNGPKTIELPYLRVANVQDGYLDLNEIAIIRVPISQVKRYQLKVGDVLMNEGGDFDKLGRGTVWRGEIDICLHQNHVFKVRSSEGRLAADFLANISSSPYGKAFFVLASKQSTNLASINSTQLKSFPIPLPPYEEQLRIQGIIFKSEEVVRRYQTEFKKFRSLKAGIMKDLLTGKVRVTELLTPQTIQE